MRSLFLDTEFTCLSLDRRLISLALSITFRCLVTAGRDISSGRASSPTVASPLLSRTSIARRAGWARAMKIASSWAALLTIWLN